MVEHLLGLPLDKLWSRLTLSLVAGTREYLAEEATLQRMGHTQLWALHQLIHPGDLGSGLTPYLTFATLDHATRDRLLWWVCFITLSEGRFA